MARDKMAVIYYHHKERLVCAVKAFLSEEFLLNTPTASHLYHTYAKDMPIIDYHCHLVPQEIADDIKFRNIGHLMLGGDHYKWRVMAACGFSNDFIRSSDDHDRFMAYAQCMPMLIGNPLYHWTHMELQRVFDISEVLKPETAQRIWDQAAEMLKDDAYSARNLIRRFDVRVICTTDDPVDDLDYHQALAKDASLGFRVLPTYRPDKALRAGNEGFPAYVEALSIAAGAPIGNTNELIDALIKRMDYFHDQGGRVSDHALDTVPFHVPDRKLADAAFTDAMAGKALDALQFEHYRTTVLIALGAAYHERGWVQQYHMNAARNNNTRLFKAFGADVGGDSMTDTLVADKLLRLLDAQDCQAKLPKTILYSLNPAANYILATAAGTFQGDTPGKVQFGSAWWFNDQLDGMRDQMKTLANVGALGNFVGMLTDSRSLVSYPRHEYFRRIVCDLIGGWVENGEYPNDEEALAAIVRGICYENAKAYFGF